MMLFDTDMLTLYFLGHPRVLERFEAAEKSPVTSIVSRIEVLQGRFDSVVKAKDADELLRAQTRLTAAENDLANVAIVPFDHAAGIEFDRMRQNKRLKSIGRKDLLIACIAMAHRATLVTRNLRHFRLVPGLRVENWAD